MGSPIQSLRQRRTPRVTARTVSTRPKISFPGRGLSVVQSAECALLTGCGRCLEVFGSRFVS